MSGLRSSSSYAALFKISVQHCGNRDTCLVIENKPLHPWLCWNGGSTKLNGSPHKYSMNILMYYLHTITSGPWYCINSTVKVWSSPAEWCLIQGYLYYNINITRSAWLPAHTVSLGISEMILCPCWCCERGIKGAMKDQIINSGANQISHIVINYSVFAGSWMHSQLILQATQQHLAKH